MVNKNIVLEIETNLSMSGNRWGFKIPKPFIDCKILDPKSKYKLVITKIVD